MCVKKTLSEKVTCKRVHIILSHLYEILEETKCIHGIMKLISGCLRMGMVEIEFSGAQGSFLEWQKCLYFDHGVTLWAYTVKKPLQCMVKVDLFIISKWFYKKLRVAHKRKENVFFHFSIPILPEKKKKIQLIKETVHPFFTYFS